jgi:hypothetical protein
MSDHDPYSDIRILCRFSVYGEFSSSRCERAWRTELDRFKLASDASACRSPAQTTHTRAHATETSYSNTKIFFSAHISFSTLAARGESNWTH